MYISPRFVLSFLEIHKKDFGTVGLANEAQKLLILSKIVIYASFREVAWKGSVDSPKDLRPALSMNLFALIYLLAVATLGRTYTKSCRNKISIKLLFHVSIIIKEKAINWNFMGVSCAFSAVL